MTARRHGGAGPLALPAPGVLRFALVDVDCGLPRELVAAWAEAVTLQASRDFARPVWGFGMSAELVVRGAVGEVEPGEVPTLLLRAPDVPDAAGYHDGTRAAKVFPLLGGVDNASVTLSHEVLERMADPDVSTAVLGPDRRVRLREVCDPVEADWYTVKVRSGASVRVSNFVGIDYFSGRADGALVAHLDAMGKLSAPGELRPSGYQTFWTRAKGYTQETRGAKSAYRATLDCIAALGGHPTRCALARLALRRGAGKGGAEGAAGPRVVDRFGVEVVSLEALE